MLKKIKIIAFIVAILAYANYAYKGYKNFKSDIRSILYNIVTQKTITLKEALDKRPELYNESAKELYIPSPEYFDPNYLEFRGFEYISELQNVNCLIFDSEYIPKNFNQTLKNMPDLKTLIFDNSQYSRPYKKDNDTLYLKDLDIEHLEGGFYGWNFDSVINTYKNLKTADIYNQLYSRLDQPNFNVSNHSLEKVKYFVKGINWHNYYRMFHEYSYEDYKELQNDESAIKDKYAIKLNLDTPKLKDLTIESAQPEFPIDLIFNNNSVVELDNLTFYKCYRPKVVSDKKIKAKSISFIQTDFQYISVAESIGGVDFDSVKKFHLNNKELRDMVDSFGKPYEKIKISNEHLKLVNQFNNLNELKIESTDILSLDFIESMPTLKNLYLDLQRTYDDYHNKRYVFYDISNLENLENLEYLTLKLDYSNAEEYRIAVSDLEVLKNLKNLKTLVVNYNIVDLLPELDGVNIIVE